MFRLRKGLAKLIIVNFMTPWAGVLVLGRRRMSHIVKMYFFFKTFLLSSQALIRQNQGIVMIIEMKTK